MNKCGIKKKKKSYINYAIRTHSVHITWHSRRGFNHLRYGSKDSSASMGLYIYKIRSSYRPDGTEFFFLLMSRVKSSLTMLKND